MIEYRVPYDDMGVRVIIPDSHGSMIDWPAARAIRDDVKKLRPTEVVWLGDHVDVGGVFSNHQKNYSEELDYSYQKDCDDANEFLDYIQCDASHFMEGNHEAHLERWASRTFASKKDADAVLERLSPYKMLKLKERGIRYYESSKLHGNLSVPGVIRLGKCLFTHGSRAGKHATSAMLDDFGTNVVHGHTHRAQSIIRRTVANGEIGAWCPGTVAKLQPLYLHTSVSSWSHGYAVQFVNKSGRFFHVQVPIVDGESMLEPLIKELRP